MKNSIYFGLLLVLVSTSSCSLLDMFETKEPAAQKTGTPGSAPKAVPPVKRTPRTVQQKAQPSSIGGLTLWLAADAIKNAENGKPVSLWQDSSGKGPSLTQKNSEKAPKLAAQAVNHLPAVKFDANNQNLEALDVKGSRLFSADQATVFIVMKASSKAKNEGFGWGDCSNHRFMGHTPLGGNMIFISGAPANTAVSAALPTDWNDNAFHVITLSRNKSTVAVYVDGALAGSRSDAKGELDITQGSTFFLGKGHCDVPFQGEIAEFVLFNAGLAKDDQQKIEGYLSAKYGLPLFN